MFAIETDPDRNLLAITMRDFWTTQIMAEYNGAVRKAIAELRRGGGMIHVLIDMRDFGIQSAEIAEGHADNLRAVARVGDARVALVMQSALSKLQAARVAHDTGHATFASTDAALAWLYAADGAATPAA